MAEPLRLAAKIRDGGVPFVTRQVGSGTLYGTVYGVRVSFLEFRYRMLDDLVSWPEYGCLLAGLRDLACMKLSAIAQRGSKKDFLDLHALGQHGFRLRDMLEWYQMKFEVQDIGHVLYALAYFDVADAEPRPKMLWETDWRDVKRTILSWVREL